MYQVTYRALVPRWRTGNQTVLSISHGNLHSCLRKVGFCTPFVANTRTLSTHSPARASCTALQLVIYASPHRHPTLCLSCGLSVTGDFELDADGAFRSTLTSALQLEEGAYTVIAHVRWFKNGTQHDMARASLSNVRAPVSGLLIALIVVPMAVAGLLSLHGLRYCCRSYHRARRDAAAALRRREAHVRDLCESSSSQSLGYPLCCVSFEAFRRAGQLITHEHARLHSLLTWHDTISEVKAAVDSRVVIFLSHQWKGRTEPDPNGDDWKAAVLAVEMLIEIHGLRLDSIDVWCCSHTPT